MKKLFVIFALAMGIFAAAPASALQPLQVVLDHPLPLALLGIVALTKSHADVPLKDCVETVKAANGNYVYDRTVLCPGK